MRGYPHFSFWIPITLAKIYFFHVAITFSKIHNNYFVLGGTVLNGGHCYKSRYSFQYSALYSYVTELGTTLLVINECMSLFTFFI